MIVSFCNNVGISDLGDAGVKQKCLEIMSKYYYRLSLNDIETAFDMVILGRLEIGQGHFGRLTAIYISNILKSYSGVLRRRQAPKKDIERENTHHGAKMKEFFEQELESFRSTGELNIHNYVSAHEYMVENDMFSITPDHQKAINEFVMKEYFPGSIDTSTPVGAILGQLNAQYGLNEAKKEYYIKRQQVIEQFKIWRDKK